MLALTDPEHKTEFEFWYEAAKRARALTFYDNVRSASFPTMDREHRQEIIDEIKEALKDPIEDRARDLEEKARQAQEKVWAENRAQIKAQLAGMKI